jgi:hypothetical protein
VPCDEERHASRRPTQKNVEIFTMEKRLKTSQQRTELPLHLKLCDVEGMSSPCQFQFLTSDASRSEEGGSSPNRDLFPKVPPLRSNQSSKRRRKVVHVRVMGNNGHNKQKWSIVHENTKRRGERRMKEKSDRVPSAASNRSDEPATDGRCTFCDRIGEAVLTRLQLHIKITCRAEYTESPRTERSGSTLGKGKWGNP